MTKEHLIKARENGEKSLIEDMINGDLNAVNARVAFAAMKQGDKVGAEIVEEYISYLASGVATMINIFQPNVLSIGGGVCNEKEYLTKPLIEIVNSDQYTRTNPKKTKVVIAELGNDAGIIGAAFLGI
jgi:glucokinase